MQKMHEGSTVLFMNIFMYVIAESKSYIKSYSVNSFTKTQADCGIFLSLYVSTIFFISYSCYIDGHEVR